MSVDAAAQKAARDELEADLKMLRRSGVRTFKGSGIDVEFFPEAGPVVAEKAAQPENDDMCACGHHAALEHVNGFCIHHCENCNTEKPK